MKRIIYTAFVTIALYFLPQTPLQAQGFDWGRMSLGVDYSFQASAMQLGSGLLRNHPERSTHLQLNYRLWRRWEVGVYASVRGSEIGYSGRSNNMGYVSIENGYDVGWGAVVQWHLIPYHEKKSMDIDIVFRLGMDIPQMEADIWWGGLGYYYSIDKHLSIFLFCDFGTFRFGRMNDFVTGQNTWNPRFSIGLQWQL